MPIYAMAVLRGDFGRIEIHPATWRSVCPHDPGRLTAPCRGSGSATECASIAATPGVTGTNCAGSTAEGKTVYLTSPLCGEETANSLRPCGLETTVDTAA
ncbi:hypothetical protein Aple_002310 [Acrocarpospora pleiomorpha]|uniref:Uncharacterized protein n=1 Tax=Acrocarpospora pleiomorpha TaxID=90975 RepID=A0A5M3X9K0_9ACTN|nr:hypothetical protein Aple_002310 [Acrocarpospora pleiomorpha]